MNNIKAKNQLEKRLDGMETGGSGVGIFVNEAKNAERFNDYAHAKVFEAGEFSHAEGNYTEASGYCAHSEGNNTTASGANSHAEGYNTKATSDQDHAEGGSTEASGGSSHAEGFMTKATGTNAHSEGNNTTASGAYSHAEGQWCTASGSYSHAEGSSTKATGAYSHASGKSTIAAGEAQAVFGEYNEEDSTSLFIIGCGTYNARANALWVDKIGNLYVRGSITSGGGTISGGAAYTAGDGIDISEDNVITVKIGEGVEISDNGEITVKKYVAGKGIEIAVDEETGEQMVAVRIGDGLKFSDDGALTANEYEAGDGLELKENKFSVKLGTGLKIADDGSIEVIGGSGGSYAAGDGIEIAEDEETGEEKISVKVGDGLEIDGNGAVSSMINADHAIIIQEANAKYLLHSYTQVDYIKGNKIGYAGPFNQIIVGGYVCYKYKGTAPNGAILNNITTTSSSELPDIPMYQKVSFEEPYIYHSGRTGFYTGFGFEFGGMDSNSITYKDTFYNTNGSITSTGSFKNYAGYSDTGWSFLWDNFIYPGETVLNTPFPYGGVRAYGARRYKSSETEYKFALDGRYWHMPFASEAEYNAAVGLTYEPLTLTEVQETATEV